MQVGSGKPLPFAISLSNFSFPWKTKKKNSFVKNGKAISPNSYHTKLGMKISKNIKHFCP
jgi:hypothetical protein